MNTQYCDRVDSFADQEPKQVGKIVGRWTLSSILNIAVRNTASYVPEMPVRPGPPRPVIGYRTSPEKRGFVIPRADREFFRMTPNIQKREV